MQTRDCNSFYTFFGSPLGVLLTLLSVVILTGCQSDLVRQVESAQQAHETGKIDEAIELLTPEKLDALVKKETEESRELRSKAEKLRRGWLIQLAKSQQKSGNVLEGVSLLRQVVDDYEESADVQEMAVAWILDEAASVKSEDKRRSLLNDAQMWDSDNGHVHFAHASMEMEAENWTEMRHHYSEYQRLIGTEVPKWAGHKGTSRLLAEAAQTYDAVEAANKVANDESKCLSAGNLFEAWKPLKEVSVDAPNYGQALQAVYRLEQCRKKAIPATADNLRELYQEKQASIRERKWRQNKDGLRVGGLFADIRLEGEYRDRMVYVASSRFTWGDLPVFKRRIEQISSSYEKAGFKEISLKIRRGPTVYRARLSPPDPEEEARETFANLDLDKPLKLTVEVHHLDPELLSLVEDPIACIEREECTLVTLGGELERWLVGAGGERRRATWRGDGIWEYRIDVKGSTRCDELRVAFDKKDNGKVSAIECGGFGIKTRDDAEKWARTVKKISGAADATIELSTNQENRGPEMLVDLKNVQPWLRVYWSDDGHMRTKINRSESLRESVKVTHRIFEEIRGPHGWKLPAGDKRELKGTSANESTAGFGEVDGLGKVDSGTVSSMKHGRLGLGSRHACAIGKNGTIQCWGSNSNGNDQLGAPSGTFQQIYAGAWHTCALDKNGEIQCWGSNSDGQARPPSGQFKQVTSGNSHSCALRLNGEVTCWGSREFGQAESPSGTFRQVGAGADVTCGVTTDGRVKCWGLQSDVLTQVPSGQFRQVATGLFHACALDKNNEVKCWGMNAEAHVAPSGGTFEQVGAGSSHTCGVATNGELKCWGSNDEGQTDAPSGTFVQVHGGRSFACAVDTGDKVQCWGSNEYGQLNVP